MRGEIVAHREWPIGGNQRLIGTRLHFERVPVQSQAFWGRLRVSGGRTVTTRDRCRMRKRGLETTENLPKCVWRRRRVQPRRSHEGWSTQGSVIEVNCGKKLPQRLSDWRNFVGVGRHSSRCGACICIIGGKRREGSQQERCGLPGGVSSGGAPEVLEHATLPLAIGFAHGEAALHKGGPRRGNRICLSSAAPACAVHASPLAPVVRGLHVCPQHPRPQRNIDSLGCHLAAMKPIMRRPCVAVATAKRWAGRCGCAGWIRRGRVSGRTQPTRTLRSPIRTATARTARRMAGESTSRAFYRSAPMYTATVHRPSFAALSISTLAHAESAD